MHPRLLVTFRKVPLFIAALAVLSVTACDGDIFPRSSAPTEATGSVSKKTEAAKTKLLRITVKGAVIKPGVYFLDTRSNVAQAILEAGGLTDQAVLGKVDLKEGLRDNMTIVVPQALRSAWSPAIPPVPPRSSPPVPAAPSPRPSSATPMAAILPAKIEIKPGQTPLMVVVKGAVNKPGAYQVAPGSVVATAIVAAGGLAPNALLDAINLQQPLRQGITVTVPSKQPAETEPPPPTVPTAAPATDRFPVDVNSATLVELQGLPGIGPSLAARIIAYRREIGAFRTQEQLMDVKGITPEKFSEIQSLIRTN